MTKYHISHSGSNGIKDKRYTITQEYCGYDGPRHVVRFCDEFIGQSIDLSGAILRGCNHKNPKKPIIEEE